MKASVNRKSCIGCGVCAHNCPQVFKMDDENTATVIVDNIDEKDKDAVMEARDACPMSAIIIEE